MPKESNIDEFPDFETWVESKTKETINFETLRLVEKQRRYETAKKFFEDTIADRILADKKAKKKIADIEFKEFKKREIQMLAKLELNITELAYIALSVIEKANFEVLEAIASMLKNPTHLDQALNEFTEKLRYDFSEAIKNSISKKNDDANINDYEIPEVSAKLQQLVNTCIDMSKPLVAQKIGCEYSEFSPTSYKSVISKTKKWKQWEKR